MPVGYWCPVLHAHLPYVRHPEYPEFLEEDWFFEALTETYVPLVDVLDGLLGDGVDYRLTMTLSPPLVSMMTDDLLLERYRRYLERLITLAEVRAALGADVEKNPGPWSTEPFDADAPIGSRKRRGGASDAFRPPSAGKLGR